MSAFVEKNSKEENPIVLDVWKNVVFFVWSYLILFLGKTIIELDQVLWLRFENNSYDLFEVNTLYTTELLLISILKNCRFYISDTIATKNGILSKAN